jgi:hypothetical protein
VPKDRVLELLNPMSFRVDEKVSGAAADPVAASIEMTLVAEESIAGKKWLRLNANEVELPSDRIADELPRFLARLLLRPELGGDTNTFATLCAWLLAQPLIGMPSGQAAIKSALVAQGFDLGELRIRNNAVLEMVVYWARYLGLVWQTKKEKCQGIVPDPSAFLTRHLDDLLPVGEEIGAPEFCSQLGQLCPVLDGGSVRAAILAKTKAVPSSELSESLSFALRRLQACGRLKFWAIDDARAPLVMAGHADEDRRITHLTRISPAKGELTC